MDEQKEKETDILAISKILGQLPAEDRRIFLGAALMAATLRNVNYSHPKLSNKADQPKTSELTG